MIPTKINTSLVLRNSRLSSSTIKPKMSRLALGLKFKQVLLMLIEALSRYMKVARAGLVTLNTVAKLRPILMSRKLERVWIANIIKWPQIA
ncbi:hypothetical protein D3C81_1641410 [compost metagenome]